MARTPTFTEQARRQQLIEATIDLISTKGYPATSLSAITCGSPRRPKGDEMLTSGSQVWPERL